jgi:protein-tyrosine phosphatase
MNTNRIGLVCGLLALLLQSAAQADIANARVERSSSDTLAISWEDSNPVDVYEGERPDLDLKSGQRIVQASRDGHLTVATGVGARHYFLLVDAHDRKRLEVAERLVPLEQGSNFRDIGGYTSAGGKRVRWGMIYRSGGQPLLTAQDVERIRALGIAQLVDLRSSEERTIAPTKIEGIPYAAVGYSMADLMARPGAAMSNGADVYRNFPKMLAPQLRIIFSTLLQRQQPIAYNCSAGQDRTGFATAMILTALGVPYDTVVQDYHLSTAYRRPEFELPKIDTALYPHNPVAQLFASYQQAPGWKTPQPLKDADGRPFLRGAFDEINEKWGSVDAYLAKEVGVGPREIAQLRKRYLQ